MGLQGSTNEEKIWNFLMSKFNNAYGVAGLMGNLYAESGFRSENLQNTYEKSLGMTDTEYTTKVDNGTYTNFVKDKAGYGLAQWTYWSRKEKLFNYAKSKKKSIGDLEMQLEFLYQELQGYKAVFSTIQNAKTIREASDIVLTQYERPADQSTAVQEKRAGFGQTSYDKFAKKTTSNQGGTTTMSNSSLVDCTVLSPNHSGKRTKPIDRITPHCVVGQLKAENIGSCFTSPDRQASCNYGIGPDGRVCLIVDEANRSWCSSSSANDQRAVTIEVASDMTEPYAFKDAAYNKLVDLCEDICRRNGKTVLLWIEDKEKALTYNPKSNEMLLTVHRWFANKSCPGNWMFSRMGNLAATVTARLGGITIKPVEPTPTPAPTPAPSTGQMYRVRKTWADAASQKGAYTNLDNAKRMCDSCGAGYFVFDKDGKAIYPEVKVETPAPTPTPSQPTKVELRDGDEIKLKAGATYWNGKAIPQWVFDKTLYYRGKNNEGIIFSTLKTGAITGVVKESSIANVISNTPVAFQPYMVKVTADALNIRKGPGVENIITGCIKDRGTYTIVEESNGWGKLKSGVGWICLSYTKKA